VADSPGADSNAAAVGDSTGAAVDGVAGNADAAVGGSAGNVRMLHYIDRMDLAYGVADIYVGRAGASTLAEINLNGLPAVLIPYPYAAENHQAFNARSLEAKGGAVVMDEDRLTGQSLLAVLQDLLGNEKKRKGMAEQSLKAANRRALTDILDIISEVMESA